jgi:hypothetical protein
MSSSVVCFTLLRSSLMSKNSVLFEAVAAVLDMTLQNWVWQWRCEPECLTINKPYFYYNRSTTSRVQLVPLGNILFFTTAITGENNQINENPQQ